jgi:hypothetical protein
MKVIARIVERAAGLNDEEGPDTLCLLVVISFVILCGFTLSEMIR